MAERDLTSYVAEVMRWMNKCFTADVVSDPIERNYRFLEEALELVQANGCTEADAHRLVDYVFGRPQGDVNPEVGGVMVTLAAFCGTFGIDLNAAAETELARVWTKIEAIRAKQAAKPASISTSNPDRALPGPSILGTDGTAPFNAAKLSYEGRRQRAALRSENARLRAQADEMAEALSALAETARTMDDPHSRPTGNGEMVAEPGMFSDKPDHYVIFRPAPGIAPITVGHLRAARTALARYRGEAS